MKKSSFIILLLMLVLSLATMAFSVTVNVANGEEFASALENKDATEIICTSDITLTKKLVIIERALTIKGNGHKLSGDNKYDGFQVEKGGELTISDFAEISNLKPREFGSAIKAKGGDIYVSNCKFVKVTSKNSGGAIICESGKIKVENCVFDTCSAKNSGGAISSQVDKSGRGVIQQAVDETTKSLETLEIYNSTFTSNSANEGGAVFIYGGQVKIQNCTFDANTSKKSGGAIFANDGDNLLDNCVFKNNKSSKQGGAVACQIKKKNSAFGFGGLLAVIIDETKDQGKMKIKDCTFESNDATKSGSAIFSMAKLTLVAETKDMVFTNNTVKNKAGKYDLKATIEKSNNHQILWDNEQINQEEDKKKK